ncbi:MAG: Asp-tRNA(Asn)/Glu-tRNA(Gln) amidotransferase subunit GatB [Deltaproteobacteria bacterium]|jgi:aspartyl-tRNA(Asn)/glutamyl-tRNA(Gln) amidotransferase subunit B|nr:Asp-tRNA(Asn)/Glu-tRNA(Gln) amidotransferase subunit GatB [Deltaproteobacteria bacterium]
MTNMEPVIGLEIHAQLNTRTKLFCSCPTGGQTEPNENICEICTGQPGALPRLNEKAVELAAKATLALGGRVNGFSLFSRKNYFYPDLPNGFQTSQLDPPVGQGGGMTLTLADGSEKFVRLNRIHMEDDAGKCVHDEKRDRTLVDLNRAGVPLIEIVTEPDLSSSQEAVDFLKKLHNALVRLEVTKGRLEEGEFRCDVNISLKPVGSPTLGVRTEIKNLNSFRFVGQAIDFEIRRQTALYVAGAPVEQQTLHFDHVKAETWPLRSKEEAHDYRYFPQPDLPPVRVSPALIERLEKSLPPSLESVMARYRGLGLKDEAINNLLSWPGALSYFEEALKARPEAKRLSTLMAELFLPACRQSAIEPGEARLKPAQLAKLAQMMAEGKLGKRAAYEIFGDLFETGADPEALVQSKGLALVSDGEALADWAKEIVAAHPDEAQKYRAGQGKILSFFVGRLMRRSKGAADPQKAAQALLDVLGPAGQG